MLQAFTRNYEDNSTDAGHQFTFYCDVCRDGYRSSFIESDTYKKKKGSKFIGQGIGIAGNLLGGKARELSWNIERGSNILNERFDDKSPEWQREHEQAFERAQNEAKQHFHRCPSCNTYVCDHCYHDDEGMCVKCAPRQEIYVAKAKAEAMKRNIDDAGKSATVWQGEIESKTTICQFCGKPAGTGKFCNNCGSNMELKDCPKCGAKNAQVVKFCNNCGTDLSGITTGKEEERICPTCRKENPPGTKFCGECGTKL